MARRIPECQDAGEWAVLGPLRSIGTVDADGFRYGPMLQWTLCATLPDEGTIGLIVILSTIQSLHSDTCCYNGRRIPATIASVRPRLIQILFRAHLP